MNKRPFDWSSIANIIVRGKKRICVARLEIDGKQVWRTTRIEADPEGLNADDVRAWLRVFKVELVKDRSKLLALTRVRDDYSTFGEIFTAYRDACAGRDISERTVDANIKWMSLVLRTVHGEGTHVEDLRASVLVDDELLRSFKEKRITAIKARVLEEKCTPEEAEQRMRKGKNSIKSIIQQARSLFSRELMQSRSYRQLTLPELQAFMEYKTDGSTVSAFVPPSKEVWQKILADLPALKETNLAQWYAFMIAANAGLRRRSARNARWAWCTENPDGSAAMHISVSKGNNSSCTISPAVWAMMQAKKSSTDYIIPLASEPERDQAITGLVLWLRKHGLTDELVDKPYHQLRKIFGDAMVQAHGLTEAQNALGHSKADLTHAVYSENRSTKWVQPGVQTA